METQEEQLNEDTKVLLRERQTEIRKILEAIDELQQTKGWKTLQEVLFSKSLDAIERQLKNEALAVKVDTDKIYKLQGEWVWAKQFMDIPSFTKTLKAQLTELNRKLQ